MTGKRYKKQFLIPALVFCRWEVIAAFIGQHVSESNKNARDVLSKAKELQKNGEWLRDELEHHCLVVDFFFF